MQNPHAERQAVLLERIVKNASKCTETLMELNHCLDEIVKANAYVRTAAELSSKYQKNVQYNMSATKGDQESGQKTPTGQDRSVTAGYEYVMIG